MYFAPPSKGWAITKMGKKLEGFFFSFLPLKLGLSQVFFHQPYGGGSHKKSSSYRILPAHPLVN